MKTMMMKLKEQEIKQSNEIITKNNAKTKKRMTRQTEGRTDIY